MTAVIAPIRKVILRRDVPAFLHASRSHVTREIAAGHLEGPKVNGYQYGVYQDSAEAWLEYRKFVIPDGYISVEQAAKLCNFEAATVSDKLRDGKWRGLRDNFGRWRAVLYADLAISGKRGKPGKRGPTNDAPLRYCLDCGILLTDTDPGPYCGPGGKGCTARIVKLAALPLQRQAGPRRQARLSLEAVR